MYGTENQENRPAPAPLTREQVEALTGGARDAGLATKRVHEIIAAVIPGSDIPSDTPAPLAPAQVTAAVAYGQQIARQNGLSDNGPEARAIAEAYEAGQRDRN